MLKLILKFFNENKIFLALLEGIVRKFAGELPGAVESMLTIRDTDVANIAGRVGIKKEQGVKALRDALRNVAVSIANVIRVVNEHRE